MFPKRTSDHLQKIEEEGAPRIVESKSHCEERYSEALEEGQAFGHQRPRNSQNFFSEVKNRGNLDSPTLRKSFLKTVKDDHML